MTFSRRVKAGASLDRLQDLIAKRLEPGSDKDSIDERIWNLFGEEWSVMFTDLSGFSRKVAKFGIIHFLQTIYEAEMVLIPVIEANDGILLKTEGDSFLVVFRKRADALDAALEMQRALEGRNRGRPEEDKVLLCLGIGHGRVLKIGDDDVFGAEVNAASKLGEDTAKAGEILVTGGFLEGLALPAGCSAEELPEAPAGAASAFRIRY